MPAQKCALAVDESRVEKAKPPPYIVRLGEIEFRQQLGGLLKHYRRKAA